MMQSITNTTVKVCRFICTLSFLLLHGNIYSQGYMLESELEIEVGESKEVKAPSFYFDVAEFDSSLYILYNNTKKHTYEIWLKNPYSDLEKNTVILPDSIQTTGLYGGFDINERYFCFVDFNHIYIGENKSGGNSYVLTHCLVNRFENNTLATDAFLLGDSIFFSSYSASSLHYSYKSFFIKYHIQKGDFSDKIKTDLKNVYYSAYNSTSPVAANNQWVAYSEPYEYKIRIVGNTSVNGDTQVLIPEDISHFWNSIPKEGIDIFNYRLNTIEVGQAKLELSQYYAFNFSSINKLFLISDSVLLVYHSYPHLRMTYLDIWKLGYPLSSLIKKNIVFNGKTLLYDRKKEDYTFIPEILSGCAFYGRNNKLIILGTNFLKKNKKKPSIVIQIFDFSENE